MKNNGKSNTMEVDGAGLIVFEKSRRARKLSISLEAPGMIRAAVPCRVSFKEAKRTISSNLQWLKKYLSRMDRLKQEHESLFKNPADMSENTAVKKLQARLKQLAAEYGFEYNKVFVRNLKSRWGSCSVKNNISLNIKLARLPQRLVDYLILHELVHTKVKSHGESFWKDLEGLIPGSKELDRRLRKYQLEWL